MEFFDGFLALGFVKGRWVSKDVFGEFDMVITAAILNVNESDRCQAGTS